MNGLKRRLLDLKAWAFYCFPHHGLSELSHRLAQVETPWIKDLMIRAFVRFFRLRMQEAEVEDPKQYPTLDALFVRSLKPELRPWPEAPDVLASPCDSRISQFGTVEAGRILQAKGQTFSVDEFLGGAHPEFAGGQFATLYLSPDDCHRVYMPTDGRLLEMHHIPGRQFTVAPYAVQRIPRLYARNERVVSLFEDTDGYPFAVVMVGAVNVASIEMSWCGTVAPRRRAVTRWPDISGPVELGRGEQMGCFHLGSTVVLITAHPRRDWAPGLEIGQPLKYGQPLMLWRDDAEAPPV